MEFKYLIDENHDAIITIDTTKFDESDIINKIYTLVENETKTQEIIDDATRITFEPVMIPIVNQNLNIDNSIIDDKFSYDYVQLGFNINVPRGRINFLRYYIELLQDGKPKSAIILDGFPKSKITKEEKFKGEVEFKVEVSKLLKLIPTKIGEVLSDIIQLDLSMQKFEIKWIREVLDIGFSGPFSSKADWWINGENSNIQEFMCRFIMRRDPLASKVTARVYAVNVYDPSFFRRAYGIKSDTVEYQLFPTPESYIIL